MNKLVQFFCATALMLFLACSKDSTNSTATPTGGCDANAVRSVSFVLNGTTHSTDSVKYTYSRINNKPVMNITAIKNGRLVMTMFVGDSIMSGSKTYTGGTSFGQDSFTGTLYADTSITGIYFIKTGSLNVTLNSDNSICGTFSGTGLPHLSTTPVNFTNGSANKVEKTY